ncbi:glycosyltransferase family protein [Megalodesulfovibrio paquesii]
MNVLLLESPRFYHVFKAQGCEVLCLSPHPAPHAGVDPRDFVQLTRMCHRRELESLLQARQFMPDLVLWCDHGYLPSIFGFEALECPVLGLTIDDYCNPWHIPFAAAFDKVFVAQKDYVPVFNQAVRPDVAVWSPLFCDERVDTDPGLARDIPVSFVGTLQPKNIPQRLPFLKRFKELAPLVLLQGRYAPIFQRSQIVLNQTAAGELNFRLFEASACGAAVLTEVGENGLEELFQPGETMLPPYPRGDAPAAAAIAREWLARPEALLRIGTQARELVRREHSLQVRARQLVAEALRLRQEDALPRRQARQGWIRQELAKACAFIAAELVQPEFARMQQTYLNLAKAYPTMRDQL